MLDFDSIGANGVKNAIENARYHNHSIFPEVKTIDARDIGEWSDDHPLNKPETSEKEILRIFGDNAKLIESLIAERDMLRTGDTCARQCEGTACRIELQRLRREMAAMASGAQS